MFTLRRMNGVAAKGNGSRVASMQETFRPLPLLGNPHVQTLLGYLWQGTVAPGATREVVVSLPDGDRVVLHDSLPPGWQKKIQPVPIVVEQRLAPVPAGYRRGILDGAFVVYEPNRGVIVDVTRLAVARS